MFVYRVYSEAGDELGEAAYTQRIKPGETVWLSGARAVEVLDVVETEGEGRYEGMLRCRRQAGRPGGDPTKRPSKA